MPLSFARLAGAAVMMIAASDGTPVSEPSASRCDLYPSAQQSFRVVVPAVARADGTSALVLRTFPGGTRDVLQSYHYLLDDGEHHITPVEITGPFTDEELRDRFGTFQHPPLGQLWVLRLPHIDAKGAVRVIAVHPEYGRDATGAACTVNVRIILARLNREG